MATESLGKPHLLSAFSINGWLWFANIKARCWVPRSTNAISDPAPGTNPRFIGQVGIRVGADKLAPRLMAKVANSNL